MALPHALVITDTNGVLTAFNRAERYAGASGHIATLPELVEARIRNVPGVNERWFTTASALHFGYSRANNPVFIVAHGKGPLMERHAREEAYLKRAHARNSHWFGTISRDLFSNLENGLLGSVDIVDARSYITSSDPAQSHAMSLISIRSEDSSAPLMRAIFGHACEEYFAHYQQRCRTDRHDALLGQLDLEYGVSPSDYWANFLILEMVQVGTQFQPRSKLSQFVAVRGPDQIEKLEYAPQLPAMAGRLREIQSAQDKLRRDVELLMEMQAVDVL